MRRAWLTWSLIISSMLLVAGAMSWISLTVLRLDEESARARAEAELEESIRLALWRLDAMVTPILVRESAYPFFVFLPYYAADRPYTEMLELADEDEPVTPSPLLNELPPLVRLHFQVEPEGYLSSPQVPEDELRLLAEAEPISEEELDQREEMLGQLEDLIEPDELLAALPDEAVNLSFAEPEVLASSASLVQTVPGSQTAEAQQALIEQLSTTTRQGARIDEPGAQRQSKAGQQELNVQEFQARAANVLNVFTLGPVSQQPVVRPDEPLPRAGALEPLWIGRELILARRVAAAGEVYVQGSWLDWPTLELQLLAAIHDLLPQARLVSTTAAQLEGDTGSLGRRLASLPLILEPGPQPDPVGAGHSPVVVSLVAAWICLGLAGVSVITMLRTALNLSERRAAFVSAVTHELRTPLTTLRIYTEMLAEGMIRDESTRQQYLDSLHSQSARLAHLVENVLAYSRLERGNSRTTREPTTLGELLDRLVPHLLESINQANLNRQEAEGRPEIGLRTSIDEATRSIEVMVDRAAVERILMNLVDNALKYGVSTAAPLIELGAEPDRNGLEITVRDHGPGVPPDLRSSLFAPFTKSATEAAHTAPGVGLGLALSRRLAREMGGELRLDATTDTGACFRLRLRRSPDHEGRPRADRATGPSTRGQRSM